MVAEERFDNNVYVDSEVAKSKFEAQWKLFKDRKQEYRDRGIFCIKKSFPILEFAFICPKLKFQQTIIMGPRKGNIVERPIPWVALALSFDYSNFDVLPPSVRLIDVLTRKEVFAPPIQIVILPSQQNMSKLPDAKFGVEPQRILIPDLDGRQFICLPGIREYHLHPEHNGDSWFLYRNKDNCKLTNLLDKIFLYSIVNYRQM